MAFYDMMPEIFPTSDSNAIMYRIRLSNIHKREEGACLNIKKKIEKIKRKCRIQFFRPRLSFPESRLSKFVFYM